ncbi:response regulator [Bacteroidota bacterium]
MMNDNTSLLYVDDEELNLTVFKLSFRSKFDVMTAESGAEGLKILNENPQIKVVISDMKMPVMNGIEFIKLAKNDYPNVCFYILTAFEITEEIKDALKGGLINKYFRKPFNMNDIETSVKEIL